MKNLIILSVMILFCNNALSHGGRYNKFGCHRVTADGSCHCRTPSLPPICPDGTPLSDGTGENDFDGLLGYYLHEESVIIQDEAEIAKNKSVVQSIEFCNASTDEEIFCDKLNFDSIKDAKRVDVENIINTCFNAYEEFIPPIGRFERMQFNSKLQHFIESHPSMKICSIHPDVNKGKEFCQEYVCTSELTFTLDEIKELLENK